MTTTKCLGGARWRMLTLGWWHTTVNGTRYDALEMPGRPVDWGWRLSRDRDCKEISRHGSLHEAIARLDEIVSARASHDVLTRVVS